MYDLVADVGSYPQFLPWCLAAREKKREEDCVHWDLVIGFKLVRERFTSRVSFEPKRRVNVTYAEGPFKYLNNHWVFEAAEDGGVEVDFYVDFEFKSVVLQKIMGALFGEAVRLMVSAFEKRAEQLYGKTSRT
jgi:coenzyme Q-binding protein COQ10